jgi:hypothetical protein
MGVRSRSGVRWSRLYSTCKGDELAPAHELGHRIALADDPGRGIADRGIVDFTLADEVVEPSENFVDGGEVIPDMQVEDVDEVRLQPFEALLDAAHHVLAVVAAGVGIGGIVL